jgi:hypothetical protein
MFVSLYFVGQAKTSSCLCSITQPGQSTKALANMWANSLRPAKLRPGQPCCRIRALFAWLISHQSAVLFSQNKPTSSNQPTVLFLSEQTSHQPSEHADDLFDRFPRARPRHSFFFFAAGDRLAWGGSVASAAVLHSRPRKRAAGGELRAVRGELWRGLLGRGLVIQPCQSKSTSDPALLTRTPHSPFLGCF